MTRTTITFTIYTVNTSLSNSERNGKVAYTQQHRDYCHLQSSEMYTITLSNITPSGAGSGMAGMAAAIPVC